MSEEPIYIDSTTRLKQERALKKAQKKARKEMQQKVGKKAATRLVKQATRKVLNDMPMDKRIQKAAARGG